MWWWRWRAWRCRGIGQGPAPAAAQTEGVELAVYNQDLALVKDHRSLDLTKGLNEVRFADVAAMIDPTSVHFGSLTDPQGTAVLEQNYEYDVVGSAKLLQKYVDQEISLVTEDGQKYTGTLLNATEDAILQSADGKVTVVKVNQIKEFDFPALPEGLITKPTLVWQVESAQGGTQDVEVTYLTNGINWYANYVAVLADDDASLDLNGWITLDNRSGASYENAKLKVIAGDINRAATDGYAEMSKQVYEAAATPAPQVARAQLFRIPPVRSAAPGDGQGSADKADRIRDRQRHPGAQVLCLRRVADGLLELLRTGPGPRLWHHLQRRMCRSCSNSRMARRKGWASRCPRARSACSRRTWMGPPS